MEHVSHKYGISAGNERSSDLDYADDVLFAERQKLLASALQSMSEESSIVAQVMGKEGGADPGSGTQRAESE